MHSGELSGNWADDPIDGVKFTGSNCGWWIGTSVESYNGIYGDTMGDPTKVFAATAFGGTNYRNTPICWVGSTAEPWLQGVENANYFDRWAKGWSTLEAAWAGMGYSPTGASYILAVTDVCLDP
jgi:hypothetical protein